MTEGTAALLSLAADLRETAPRILQWYDTRHAAILMNRAADVIERLSNLEADIEVERGEN